MPVNDRMSQLEDGAITEWECATSILTSVAEYLTATNRLTEENVQVLESAHSLTLEDTWGDKDAIEV